MKQKQTGGNMNTRKKPMHQKKKPASVPAGVSATAKPEKPPVKPAAAKAAETVKKPPRIVRPDYPEEEMTLEMLDKYGTPPADREGPVKKTKPAGCLRVNLESGMPTVEEALFRMHAELNKAKQRGCRTVKLIHGYGSTGTGGKIRTGVLKELAGMKSRRQITDFIPGEEFGPFGYGSHPALNGYPALTKDPDYGKTNQGITVVII